MRNTPRPGISNFFFFLPTKETFLTSSILLLKPLGEQGGCYKHTRSVTLLYRIFRYLEYLSLSLLLWRHILIPKWCKACPVTVVITLHNNATVNHGRKGEKKEELKKGFISTRLCCPYSIFLKKSTQMSLKSSLDKSLLWQQWNVSHRVLPAGITRCSHTLFDFLVKLMSTTPFPTLAVLLMSSTGSNRKASNR